MVFLFLLFVEEGEEVGGEGEVHSHHREEQEDPITYHPYEVSRDGVRHGHIH